MTNFKTKSISKLAILLVVAMLATLFAFPSSALKDSVTNNVKTGTIVNTVSNVHVDLGRYTDTVSYDTSTRKVSWEGVTEGVYTMTHAPNDIRSGDSDATVYARQSDSTVYVAFYTTFLESITSDNNGYYYTTSGNTAVKNIPEANGTHIRYGKVVFTNSLTSKLGEIGGYSGTFATTTFFTVTNYTTVAFT